MPLLTVDPNSEVEPSYDAPELIAVLQARLQQDEMLEQIIVQMKSNWAIARQQRIQQWDEQEADRRQAEEQARLAAEAEQRRQEEEAAARARNAQLQKEKEEREAAEREKAKEQVDRERKKVKVNTLAKGRQVETTYIARPTQYALQKLKNFDYIELYYFMPEGCENGVREDITAGDSAVAASRIDRKIVFQAVSAHKPSSKAVDDTKLSWEKILVAQTLLLEAMDKADWLEDLVLSLRTFYYELANHSMHCKEMGPEAIVLYQAQVRREWWDALKAPAGEVFDIGIINKERLEAIH